jgi:photosystem II stability/assembly factor-like uncharacterized protein
MSLAFGPSRTVLLTSLLLALSGDMAAQVWVETGPKSIHGVVDIPPDNPAVGAVNAIAIDPTNPQIMYAAAVNGGIWKTENGLAPEPSWITTTDQQLPALSIRSIVVSPVDSKTIYAGTGSNSNDVLIVGPNNQGFGLVKSSDAGLTWKILASDVLAGSEIDSIALSSTDPDLVIVTASGVWRSADGGNSFTQIGAGSGLPYGAYSSVLADPTDSNRFFVGLIDTTGNGASGVYRSNDRGLSWSAVNEGPFSTIVSDRMLLAINPAGVLYSMLIAVGNSDAPVFRSDDQGNSWTSMGSAGEVFPDFIGPANYVNNGAIAADPTNNYVVFVAGAGTRGIFRGDASQPSASVWSPILAGDLANGTAPHEDSRGMRFDANGNLVYTCDGGVYRLVDPNNLSQQRAWQDMNGNLAVTEALSAAYDPVSRIFFAGTQDNGGIWQTGPGSPIWSIFCCGDGGFVAVDAISIPGQSTRYAMDLISTTLFRFLFDATNTFLGASTVSLAITSGPGAGQTVYDFDPFHTIKHYALNTIDPSHLLLATSFHIYESFDRGDTVENIGDTALDCNLPSINNLSYGSRLNGTVKPDVFYIGRDCILGGATILYRAPGASVIRPLAAYPSDAVQLRMDPQNYKKVYVLDSQRRVWSSTDEGESWLELTPRLPSLCSQARSLELYSPDATSRKTALLVGCDSGVYVMRRPGAAGTAWIRLGELPHTLVMELQYDYSSDVLTAATLGRGVWTLSGFFGGAAH